MDRLVKAIKELRSRLGDSQPAFANRLGLSGRAVANYEAGRHPTRAILQRLSTLASRSNSHDLASVFAGAFSAAMRGKVVPIGLEEKMWCRMLLLLLRHRVKVLGMEDIGKALLSAGAEALIAKGHLMPDSDREELDRALCGLRNHVAPTGEVKAKSLAKERSKATGESLEKSYLHVLLSNPELYEEARKDLGRDRTLPMESIDHDGVDGGRVIGCSFQ